MATIEATYAVVSLTEPKEESEGHGAVRVRRDLGISGFGATAFTQANAGEPVVVEHSEAGPAANKHEELYVVIKGSATFTIEGEDLVAHQGQAVFVRDPAATRKAVANEEGTTVLAIGGRPGEPFKVSPYGALSELWPLYNAKDYDAAERVIVDMLEEYPGNAFALYNLACVQSLLGRGEDAIANLRDAVDAWPKYKENAAADDDFASIKDDPRFQALVA